MTKQLFTLLTLLFALLLVSPGYAQTAAPTVDSLQIELWPDYDRTAVLVLFTGTLASDTPLPATVTLPLPIGAEVNAVARITADGTLTDDIQSSTSVDAVTFTTPDLRFRVEYYQPYTVESTQHSFTFDWLANFAVNELTLSIQQPTAATNLQTEPPATAQNGRDGFTYHVLPSQAVPANQPYQTTLRYTMATPKLSVDNLPDVPNLLEVATVESVTTSSPSIVSQLDWPLIIAGVGSLLIIIAVTWQLATYRAQRQTIQQRVTRHHQPASTQARFCRQCGKPLKQNDKFCRSCGTARSRE